MKRKILYIAPHLSTGGMPQYLYKQMELLKDEFEIYCVEWGDVTGGVLVVQRNKIKTLLGNRLITLGEKKEELFEVIKRINPEVVHLQEIPELFMSYDISEKLYSKERNYSIIETSHDSSQSSKSKRFFPDKFLFVSQYQVGLYKELGIPSDVVEYPIEYFQRTKTKEQAQKELGMNPNLKHIINVGLFTPRKNQAEIIEYAKALKDYPIQFHFIGNQADNFKYYWEPLMKDFPSNCKWWNERTDVENFYQAADLFLFTSRGSEHDKETMPLVIREAISWKVPSLIYNLSVYENYFDKFDNIEYLDYTSLTKNQQLIVENLKFKKMENKLDTFSMNIRWDEDEQKLYYSSNSRIDFPFIISIKHYQSDTVIWSTKHDMLPENIEYWMIPVSKDYMRLKDNDYFTGVKVCVYKCDTDELLYEVPYFYRFVDIPKVKLTNSIPNHMNYVEFFIEKKYSKWLDRQYKNVVDAGANVGIFTEYMLQNKFAEKIYSIECDTLALKDLKNNFSKVNSVEIIDKALSVSNEKIKFYQSKENPVISSTLSPDTLQNHMAGVKGDNIYEVDTITIKDLLHKVETIDLLKMDIEGGEYAILEKLDDKLFDNINNLFIECHFFEKDYIEKYNALKNKLIRNNYNIEELIDNSNMQKYAATSECIFATKKHNMNIENHLIKNPCGNKRDLASLVNNLFPNGKGVEIGVLKGDYSKIILERWHKGTLFLVDTWRHIDSYIDMNGQDDKYHYDCLIKTCENIKPWQDRAHVIRMDSVSAANMFPDEYFDFIYIDADHSYEAVVRDLKAWWPKIKKGGLFCGDDYIPDDGDIWLTVGNESTYAGKFGVRRAVNEFVKENNLHIFETLEEPYWKQWYTFKK
jgi:FkbM family methyltransferase